MTHFEVSRGEPSFSLNLKRGIVALFNLNLDRVETEISNEDNEIERSDPNAHYYNVYEVRSELDFFVI